MISFAILLKAILFCLKSGGIKESISSLVKLIDQLPLHLLINSPLTLNSTVLLFVFMYLISKIFFFDLT